MTETAAPAAPAARFRYLGVTDDCVECQKCGKTELRSTVVLALLDVDGNVEDVTYYGSTCAARALAVRGGGRAVLQSARWAHEATMREARYARERLALYGADDAGQWADADAYKAGRRLFARNNFRDGATVDQYIAQLAECVTAWVARVSDAKRLDPAF